MILENWVLGLIWTFTNYWDISKVYKQYKLFNTLFSIYLLLAFKGTKNKAFQEDEQDAFWERFVKHLCNLDVKTCQSTSWQCFLTRLISSLLFRKCIPMPPALSRPAETCFFFCVIYKTPITSATNKQLLMMVESVPERTNRAEGVLLSWNQYGGPAQALKWSFLSRLSFIHILVQITWIHQIIIQFPHSLCRP